MLRDMGRGVRAGPTQTLWYVLRVALISPVSWIRQGWAAARPGNVSGRGSAGRVNGEGGRANSDVRAQKADASLGLARPELPMRRDAAWHTPAAARCGTAYAQLPQVVLSACSNMVVFGGLHYRQGDGSSLAQVLRECLLREAEVETGLHRRPRPLAGAYDHAAGRRPGAAAPEADLGKTVS